MLMKLFAAAAMTLGIVGPLSAGEVNLKERFPDQVRQIEDKLRDLGQGNERSSEVTKAVLNTDNGDVTVEAKIRSRHRVKGGPRWARYDVTVHDWTVSGTITFNWRTGKINGKVDFGHGIEVSVADIARLLAAAK